mgnify:CR=1 FL=1
MPELPEVETIVRDLASVLVGRKITNARFYNLAIREDGDYKRPSVLTGKKLTQISRRGKNIIFKFESSLAMICHLKMTGRLIIEKKLPVNMKHLHFSIKFKGT